MGGRDNAIQFDYLYDFMLAELGCPDAFATSHTPMRVLVLNIFFWCRPTKVVWAYAAFTAIAAPMRGVVLICWRKAVLKNAHGTMRTHNLTAVIGLSVPVAVLTVRPQDALIAIMPN